MADIGAAAQERLSALLNESVRQSEAQARRDAWTFYQKARGPWLDGMVAAWQRALLPPTRLPTASVSEDGFQLVGTEVVEDKIEASRLVRGALDKLSAPIDDLKIRMRLLEGRAEFEDHDVLRPEVVIEETAARITGDPRFNSIWTSAGTPCVTLPAGTGAKGLPLGIQLIGRRHEDDRLLSTAAWVAAHLD